MFSRFRSKKPVTTGQDDEEDFFRFTSGRFLWDEEKQRKERYRRFNVTALQEIAIAKVGAKRCVSMTKISETGGNRVFRLVFDRKSAIVKMPWPGNPLRMLSEAATMDFASMMGIPVPKLLHYSTNDAVGAGYILMEDAAGEVLSNVKMSPDDKAEIVRQVAEIVNKLANVQFTQIGSLYFAADNIPGAVPAVVTPRADRISQRYCIGPVALQRGESGPWHTPKDYWKGVASRELEYLKNAPERTQQPLQVAPQGTVEEHVELWRKFEAAAEVLDSLKPELLRATLWHGALMEENIVVRKKKITLIDWEGSWVQPLALCYQKPVTMFGPLPTRGTEDLDSLDGDELADAINSIQWHYFVYQWRFVLKEKGLEEGPYPMVHQLFMQARNTWNEGAFMMRQMLIDLYLKWTEICGQACPYEISRDDIERQRKEEEMFQALMGFNLHLRDVVKNGFVPDDIYEDVVKMVVEVREKNLGVEDESVRDVLGGLAWVDSLK